MTGFLLTLLLAAAPAASPSPAPSPAPAQAVGSGLDLMHVDLLFVGAHPDDDGGILSSFGQAIAQGHRAAVVTATGGEGGANAIGKEAGRALGLLRTEEERRALATVGITQFHSLGLEDFHFTLSAEETLAHWGEAYVCDVAREVRVRRPDVIVTMWPGPGTHGQHQMAARAATLAFDRAGDPSFCPAQIAEEFLTPYAPAKLYYYTGGATPTLLVPTDTFNAEAGMRWADLKMTALRQYRSQGFEGITVPAKKADPERFLLVRSRVPVESPERDLLDGTGGVRLEV